MIDHSTKKLGRLPSAQDDRTLRLSTFRTPGVPPPPPQRLWQTPVPIWGTMGNNQYGNCVICTAAHVLLSMRANESNDNRQITDNAVIELSREMGALDGYDILQRNKYWRNKGMWGNYLWAFATVNPANAPEVRSAVNDLGCLDIGLALPKAWQTAPVWDVGIGRSYIPGSWGLHSVPIVGYSLAYVYVVTWGAVQPITWPGLTKYSDEAYALLNPEWIARDAVSPSGYDLNALHKALFALTGKGLSTQLSP